MAKSKIESRKLRGSANGELCQMNIAGVCNYDKSTTILAHLPGCGHGTAEKSSDLNSAYACSNCHDIMDGRRHMKDFGLPESEWTEHREFYYRRGNVRTLEIFRAKGLIKIA